MHLSTDRKAIEIDSKEYSYTYLKSILEKAEIIFVINEADGSLSIRCEELNNLMNYLRDKDDKTPILRLILCELLMSKMQLENKDIKGHKENFNTALAQHMLQPKKLTKVKQYPPITPFTDAIADFSRILKLISPGFKEFVATSKQEEEQSAVSVNQSFASEHAETKKQNKTDSDYISELKQFLLDNSGPSRTSRVAPITKGGLISHVKDILDKINDCGLIYQVVQQLRTEDKYLPVRQRKGFITLSIGGHSDGTTDVSETFTLILKAAKLRMAKIALEQMNKPEGGNNELLRKLTNINTEEGQFINTKLSHPTLFFWKTSKTMKILRDSDPTHALERLTEEENKFNNKLRTLSHT